MFQSVILCAFYLYFFPYPKMRKIFFTILHKSLKVFIMTPWVSHSSEIHFWCGVKQ